MSKSSLVKLCSCQATMCPRQLLCLCSTPARHAPSAESNLEHFKIQAFQLKGTKLRIYDSGFGFHAMWYLFLRMHKPRDGSLLRLVQLLSNWESLASTFLVRLFMHVIELLLYFETFLWFLAQRRLRSGPSEVRPSCAANLSSVVTTWCQLEQQFTIHHRHILYKLLLRCNLLDKETIMQFSTCPLTCICSS
jgi:hypothetical protein